MHFLSGSQLCSVQSTWANLTPAASDPLQDVRESGIQEFQMSVFPFRKHFYFNVFIVFLHIIVGQKTSFWDHPVLHSCHIKVTWVDLSCGASVRLTATQLTDSQTRDLFCFVSHATNCYYYLNTKTTRATYFSVVHWYELRSWNSSLIKFTFKTWQTVYVLDQQGLNSTLTSDLIVDCK